ncbi:MAG: imidazoleglycerol-phosphate dehydratase HisB [Janthinobacterium lividum]
MSNNPDNASDLHLPIGVVQELEAGMDRGSLPEGSAPQSGSTTLEAGTENHAASNLSPLSPAGLSSRSEAEGSAFHPAPSQQFETAPEGARRLAPETRDPNARTGTIDRNTTETKIKLTVNLDGQGTYNVRTGIRFFDHMLELFTRHGGFDLDLICDGDLDVDQHHTVEDVGIALGEAFDKALGDKKGILRAGYFVMAMDETLAVAAIDLSGRTGYVVDDQVNVPLVGDFQTELVTDFFDGFARGGRCNVHVKTMYGRSNHHKIEAIFKAFARALRGAVSRDERMKDLLPSTKGLL